MKKALIVILILVIIGGGATYFWFHNLTKKVFIERSKAAPAITNSMQQSLDEKKPINMLLLGYGGGNHDGTYLTDSIIAVHIDPKSQKVFLISIPRDTWVKIPTDGASGSYSKINAAYQDGLDDTSYPNKQAQFTGPDGGGRLSEYAITQVTGIPFDYFVGMDFSGFTHTIDTLGGVDLTVQKTFDDYQYPIEGQEDATCGLSSDQIASFSAQLASSSATISEQEAFPCRYEHLHFDQGQQHMDGTKALKYVRSRHSLQDGTDFGRAQRQRNLIVAVKQKLFSPTFIPQIVPFMSSLGDDLKTDLSIDDVKTLLQNINTLNKYQIVSLALTDQNYLTESVSSDGQDILASKDGNDNWTKVHNWLTNEFNGKSPSVAAVIQVQNGTTTAGLAQTVTDKLKAENKQVVEPGNATSHNVKQTSITVSDKNVNPSTITALQKEFGVKKATYTTTTQTDFNVLIVLGNDYSIKVNK
ncbi:MAG: LCP family protein [Candidatus Levyibacteriota bacterium]